ncbi:MAG: Ger(x)C family spore germination C-terminal domain-containing protein, partial [Clostridia bacterium]
IIFNKMTLGTKGDLYLYDSYFRLLGESESSVLPFCALNDIKFLTKSEEPTEPPSEEASDNPSENETIPSYFSEYTDDFAINTVAGETVASSDNPAEIRGVAVLKGGKYVCILGRLESRNLQIITNSFPDTYVSFSNPEAPQTMVTCYVSQKKRPEIKVDCKENPVIDVKVYLEGDFTQVGQYSDCIKDPQSFEIYAEEGIKESLIKFLNKTSKEIDSDICGFSEVAKSNFATINQWKDYNWKEKFKNAQFNVSVDITMRTYGELSQKGR